MVSSLSGFSWPARVYVEDTDFGGVVFYANYLKYFERARTEFLRSFGVSQQSMVEAQRVIFVVTNATIDYILPARLDDELVVTAVIEKIGRASMKFRQEVRRGSSLLVTALITVACVGVETMRPQAIPDELLSKLNLASAD